MADLFRCGHFTLASGAASGFKIDCDALTDEDIECLAALIAERVPAFASVEGVPTGGLRLASALQQYAGGGGLLIVDDVWTTGASMRRQRGGRDAQGAVIFARAATDPWVTPLFAMCAEASR